MSLNLRIAFAAALVVATGGFPNARALEISEWKNRQSLVVEQAGVIKFSLPIATLDRARSGLEDLRLLDAAGHELPFVIEESQRETQSGTHTAATFRTSLVDSATQIELTTGTPDAISRIELVTPEKNFIKAVRVETSADGTNWKVLSTGAIVFRQSGAEQLSIEFEGEHAGRVRLTIDDTKTSPVPFIGARMQTVPTTQPAVTRPLEIRIVRREEFAGESVLTLDLGAAHVPLASIDFATDEPLFVRTLSFRVRELRDDAAAERTLREGSIYRISVEGSAPTAKLNEAVDFTAPSRELLVHIFNGDSPPLVVDRVSAQQRPRWIVFRAAEPGTFTLLTGNAQASAPRYDLAALAAALKAAAPSAISPGPIEANPSYHRPETLADTPLLGAPIDVVSWGFRKAIEVTASGVQELELDPDVLARAQTSLGDLRVVRDGAQLPYLVERTAVARSTPLALTKVDNPQRPRVSRWEIKLPRAGLPIARVSFATSTALFQRHLRLFEKVTDDRGAAVERTLAEADWSKVPGKDRPLSLNLASVPTTARLELETDNGDNAPLALSTASAALPVTRLLFKAAPGALALYYGNPSVDAPRYDLSLVADQILAAEKSRATLSAEEPARSEGWSTKVFSGLRGGVIFWSVLALVVVALLVVVAKLLPKPPAA